MSSLCRRTVEGEWEVVAVLLRRGLRESVGAFDAEIFHPAAQGARIEIQDPRRAAFAFNHPVGLPEHRLNVLALDLKMQAQLVTPRIVGLPVRKHREH